MKENHRNQENQQEARPAPKINLINIGIQFGLIFALPMAIFMWLGIYADKTFKTTPLFILIGFFLAVAVSSVMIYKRVKKIFYSLKLLKK